MYICNQMTKLTEKYLERISHSTEFSKPVVLTKHVCAYGAICATEAEIELLNETIEMLSEELPVTNHNIIALKLMVKTGQEFLNKIKKENNL